MVTKKQNNGYKPTLEKIKVVGNKCIYGVVNNYLTIGYVILDNQNMDKKPYVAAAGCNVIENYSVAEVAACDACRSIPYASRNI